MVGRGRDSDGALPDAHRRQEGTNLHLLVPLLPLLHTWCRLPSMSPAKLHPTTAPLLPPPPALYCPYPPTWYRLSRTSPSTPYFLRSLPLMPHIRVAPAYRAAAVGGKGGYKGMRHSRAAASNLPLKPAAAAAASTPIPSHAHIHQRPSALRHSPAWRDTQPKLPCCEM